MFLSMKNENCHRPVRSNNSWSNNYIEYKSNSDKNRILSVEENLDKIRSYLETLEIISNNHMENLINNNN